MNHLSHCTLSAIYFQLSSPSAIYSHPSKPFIHNYLYSTFSTILIISDLFSFMNHLSSTILVIYSQPSQPSIHMHLIFFIFFLQFHLNCLPHLMSKISHYIISIVSLSAILFDISHYVIQFTFGYLI